MFIILLFFRTNDYFPSDRLPPNFYVESKSPIGQDLRENLKAFKPHQKLRLSSMNPDVIAPLFKEIKY
jgi:hypothetical protein